MTEVHDGSCRSVFGGGELSRIAVGEESVAWLDEGERVLAYFFADVDIFLLDAQRLVAQETANLGDGFACCVLDDGFHTVQRP